MHVRPLVPRDLPDLHARFSRICEPVRHGFAPTFDEFAQPLLSSPPHLTGTAVLVAEDGDIPVGFARVGTAVRMAGWTLARSGDALLFGPFYPLGAEAAGSELLRVAMAHADRTGAPTLWAFDPSEATCMPGFNGGVGLLPEQLTHLVRLLAVRGFRILHRELCMELVRAEQSAEIAAPAGLEVLRGQRDGQNTVGVADADGSPMGECRFSPMYPLRSLNPEARQVGYVDALAVGEPHRGRGLGRLLIGEALADLRRMGCRAVRLTTGSENYRAQNLYYSQGWTLTGSAITMRRR